MDPLSWSTEDIVPGERVEAWRGVAEQFFGPLGIHPGSERPFHASLRATTVGMLRLVEVSGSGHRCVRGPRPRSLGAGLALVNIQLSGWSRAATSTDFLVTPAGRLSIVATPGPELVDFSDDFRQLLITLPVAPLRSRLPDLGPTCGWMLEDDASTAVIIHRVTHLLDHGHELDPALATLVGRQLADLIVEAFAQQTDRDDTQQSAVG